MAHRLQEVDPHRSRHIFCSLMLSITCHLAPLCGSPTRAESGMRIYHRRRDIYELPQLLSSMVDDYRYYLGHHGPYHTETDLYAIPAERV